MADKIKLGIIGIGNMGTGHAINVAISKLCPKVELVAVADINPQRLAWAKEALPGVTCFDSATEMLDSGLIDSCIVAVPHYFHPQYVTECLKRGIHVLTEKPAGVYTAQVRQMNECAAHAGVKFAIMFNQRTDPLFIKAREIVQSGQLGTLKRMVWIITNWYRTQAYYNSGSWRGTWNGEGGGVLLNQAPHNLDIWQWICWMPKSVRAVCTAGKYHNISVEDDVEIHAEYENGMTATFISSTGETPGTNRLEITGDLGKIVLENGKLCWWKLEKSEREICFTSSEAFYAAKPEYEEFTAESVIGHPIVLENFAEAILDGAALIAPGEEGIRSLTLSNAAYLSSWENRTVELPLDEQRYLEHLRALCKTEQEKNPVVPIPAGEGCADRWKVRW